MAEERIRRMVLTVVLLEPKPQTTPSPPMSHTIPQLNPLTPNKDKQ